MISKVMSSKNNMLPEIMSSEICSKNQEHSVVWGCVTDFRSEKTFTFLNFFRQNGESQRLVRINSCIR